MDPQLDEIKHGVQIMLCDGTIAAGTLALVAASEICDTASLAGVNGTADCTGSSYQAETGSFIHRDKGISDPTQISLADAKGNDSLPSEYREIPVVATDDYGTPNTASVNRVVRGTNEWNGGVPRRICGEGIASIADRIANCDTVHTIKPDWDHTPTDGAINWQGAINGNASEGNWTLVTVYSSIADEDNGDPCTTGCYEVWRDDRTGLIWSDRLGDHSNTVNSGKWNWCVATGNTEDNTNGVECRQSQAGSLNNQALSLCAQGIGLTTPDSRWTETDNTNLGAPTYTGANEILDAKGGMRLEANHDPAGSSPVMRWRVPTVHDYFAGLANGVFYVLPHIHYTTAPWGEWSASVYATVRDSAWLFGGSGGGIAYAGRNGTSGVRCVGRP